MDRNTAVGVTGTFVTVTLEDVHLYSAIVCGLLTAIHLSVSIYVKLKNRK